MKTAQILEVVKKPLPARAFQWKGVSAKNKKELLHFLEETGCPDIDIFSLTEKGLCIHTLEGKMQVQDGAYIICGNANEYWAVREDIFLNTYNIIDGPDAANAVMKKYIAIINTIDEEEGWLLIDAFSLEEARHIAKADIKTEDLLAINEVTVNDESGVSHSFIINE
ncbi:hypothetical protein HB825_15195 [Listeria booriae]|nr:hypothetical protein [Listeria booriae]MBC1943606.1 hypothetical protein [Listeria booriae]MBC6129994.1 hypothetical protein [Listeria booriae]MBC6136184.1 hypothetical protein [Listeria booriae]MBC6166952.1 hypothetical protein [Listeria booriae]